MNKQTQTNMGGEPVDALDTNTSTGRSVRALRNRIIAAVNGLDINAEAQADGLNVEVRYFCWATAREQMRVRFNGDADLEKVAQACEGIRTLIDKKM